MLKSILFFSAFFFISSCINSEEKFFITDEINVSSIDSIVIESNICGKHFSLSKPESDTILSRMGKMKVANPYLFTPELKLILYSGNKKDTILTNGNATKPFKGEYFFCDSNIFKNIIPIECYHE